ncbi:MAG: hypothetical protein ACLFTK_15405, partial [Anaerolineales bacterium]
DFSNTDVWADGSRDENLSWQVTPDGFALSSTGPNASARYAPGTDFTATDFYAELTFQPSVCPTDDSALLFNVRSDPTAERPVDATGYVFVLQCDGAHRARLVQGGDPQPVDFNGTLDAGLSLDTPSVMGIQLSGDQVAWYLNGQLLAQYVGNPSPSAGQFVLGAQLGLQYTLQRLQIWELSGVAPDTTTGPALDDPLRETDPGRNHVVENFADPATPLLVGWAAELPAIRISEQLLTHNTQPFQARLLADPPPDNFGIFATQINFQMRQCGPTGGLGLYFGESETNGLAVVVTCEGQIQANVIANGEPSNTLLSEQVPPIARFSGGELLQTVWVNDTLFVYYNQTLVGSFAAPDVRASRIGLAWTASEAEITRVLIDNFIIAERLAR